MDPFVLVDQAVAQGRLPQSISKALRKRSRYLIEAVQRVQRAARLSYPPFYVEPSLPIATSSVEFGSAGILYSRVIPTNTNEGVIILVQFTAPLLLYGTKGTIEAVAAHEFTHYVDLVRRLSSMAVTSDEESGTLFESGYADTERTVDPKLLFSEKALISLLKRKFKGNLLDESLNAKVTTRWVEKGLPSRAVSPTENVVRLRAAAVAISRFDPAVLNRIGMLEGAPK
jgi:hypothetical protein